MKTLFDEGARTTAELDEATRKLAEEEIQSLKLNLYNISYSVDLATRQCACRRWDLTGIPCKHAVYVLDDNQDDPEKYVADYYQSSYLKNTYVDNIKPVNGEQLWTKTWKPPIGIPNIRKPRGRPKKRDRKKEPFESLQNAGKSTRHGRIPHCSRCGQAGHIKSGCKNELVVVEGPKNRRGRPRKLASVEVQPLRQPKPRKPRANPAASSQPLPTTATIINQTSDAISSQQLQSGQSSSTIPTSSAPHPSISSNKPKAKKRGRPLKTRKVENIPRGVGTFWSPFTGWQVFGDKAYDMSNNDPQRPL
ncbi:uncharacterized protein LOC110227137 [Arabidopsis lyrata subsp. lyrata]|uniref:uncharacterized protein LOC110227137 n=1 Tax=Arabidopsis lyrata subsp. lyrata TaxID=81972 RepID=UPI000A29E450|nr:uncharacterized protein LOC110227137 [Arabidopsis lyrata subsp. lyrata]|eukprot:XP_020876132.1 uncharacterized protein LOC110227137 [Arabidopsis lyrata subsp. lyrata]